VSHDDPIAVLEEQHRRFKRRVQGLGRDYLWAAGEALHDGKAAVEVVWNDERELVNATDFFIYAREWAEEALKLRHAKDDPQDGPEHHLFTAQFEQDAQRVMNMAEEMLDKTLSRSAWLSERS
jgi:hypothetical protein